MMNALARLDGGPQERSAQAAALRRLLEEVRLVALNAAIESAAAADVPGEDAAEAERIASAVDLVLQQIRSASSLTGPL